MKPERHNILPIAALLLAARLQRTPLPDSEQPKVVKSCVRLAMLLSNEVDAVFPEDKDHD